MSICWDRSQISRASFRAISLCEREEIFMPSSTSDFQILQKQNSNMYWNKGSSNLLARCGEKQGTTGVYKSIGQCSISTSKLLNLLENFNPYLCDVQKLVAQSNRRDFFR